MNINLKNKLFTLSLSLILSFICIAFSQVKATNVSCYDGYGATIIDTNWISAPSRSACWVENSSWQDGDTPTLNGPIPTITDPPVFGNTFTPLGGSGTPLTASMNNLEITDPLRHPNYPDAPSLERWTYLINTGMLMPGDAYLSQSYNNDANFGLDVNTDFTKSVMAGPGIATECINGSDEGGYFSNCGQADPFLLGRGDVNSFIALTTGWGNVPIINNGTNCPTTGVNISGSTIYFGDEPQSWTVSADPTVPPGPGFCDIEEMNLSTHETNSRRVYYNVVYDDPHNLIGAEYPAGGFSFIGPTNPVPINLTGSTDFSFSAGGLDPSSVYDWVFISDDPRLTCTLPQDQMTDPFGNLLDGGINVYTGTLNNAGAPAGDHTGYLLLMEDGNSYPVASFRVYINVSGGGGVTPMLTITDTANNPLSDPDPLTPGAPVTYYIDLADYSGTATSATLDSFQCGGLPNTDIDASLATTMLTGGSANDAELTVTNPGASNTNNTLGCEATIEDNEGNSATVNWNIRYEATPGLTCTHNGNPVYFYNNEPAPGHTEMTCTGTNWPFNEDVLVDSGCPSEPGITSEVLGGNPQATGTGTLNFTLNTYGPGVLDGLYSGCAVNAENINDSGISNSWGFSAHSLDQASFGCEDLGGNPCGNPNDRLIANTGGDTDFRFTASNLPANTQFTLTNLGGTPTHTTCALLDSPPYISSATGTLVVNGRFSTTTDVLPGNGLCGDWELNDTSGNLVQNFGGVYFNVPDYSLSITDTSGNPLNDPDTLLPGDTRFYHVDANNFPIPATGLALVDSGCAALPGSTVEVTSTGGSLNNGTANDMTVVLNNLDPNSTPNNIPLGCHADFQDNLGNTRTVSWNVLFDADPTIGCSYNETNTVPIYNNVSAPGHDEFSCTVANYPPNEALDIDFGCPGQGGINFDLIGGPIQTSATGAATFAFDAYGFANPNDYPCGGNVTSTSDPSVTSTYPFNTTVYDDVNQGCLGALGNACENPATPMSALVGGSVDYQLVYSNLIPGLEYDVENLGGCPADVTDTVLTGGPHISTPGGGLIIDVRLTTADGVTDGLNSCGQWRIRDTVTSGNLVESFFDVYYEVPPPGFACQLPNGDPLTTIYGTIGDPLDPFYQPECGSSGFAETEIVDLNLASTNPVLCSDLGATQWSLSAFPETGNSPSILTTISSTTITPGTVQCGGTPFGIEGATSGRTVNFPSFNVDWSASCGNGIMEPSQGETCDDDNRVPEDGCNELCQIEGAQLDCPGTGPRQAPVGSQWNGLCRLTNDDPNTERFLTIVADDGRPPHPAVNILTNSLGEADVPFNTVVGLGPVNYDLFISPTFDPTGVSSVARTSVLITGLPVGGDTTGGGDNTGGDNTGGDNTGGDNTGGDNTDPPLRTGILTAVLRADCARDINSNRDRLVPIDELDRGCPVPVDPVTDTALVRYQYDSNWNTVTKDPTRHTMRAETRCGADDRFFDSREFVFDAQGNVIETQQSPPIPGNPGETLGCQSTFSIPSQASVIPRTITWDLILVDKGTCGNAVLDPGEVCDGEIGCNSTCDGFITDPFRSRCFPIDETTGIRGDEINPGGATHYVYDSLDRRIIECDTSRAHDSLSINEYHYEYDGGVCRSESDPNLSEFIELRGPSTTNSLNDTTWRFEYDPLPGINRCGLGFSAVNRSDASNRLTGPTTIYTYDARGNLLRDELAYDCGVRPSDLLRPGEQELRPLDDGDSNFIEFNYDCRGLAIDSNKDGSLDPPTSAVPAVFTIGSSNNLSSVLRYDGLGIRNNNRFTMNLRNGQRSTQVIRVSSAGLPPGTSELSGLIRISSLGGSDLVRDNSDTNVEIPLRVINNDSRNSGSFNVGLRPISDQRSAVKSKTTQNLSKTKKPKVESLNQTEPTTLLKDLCPIIDTKLVELETILAKITDHAKFLVNNTSGDGHTIGSELFRFLPDVDLPTAQRSLAIFKDDIENFETLNLVGLENKLGEAATAIGRLEDIENAARNANFGGAIWRNLRRAEIQFSDNTPGLTQADKNSNKEGLNRVRETTSLYRQLEKCSRELLDIIDRADTPLSIQAVNISSEN